MSPLILATSIQSEGSVEQEVEEWQELPRYEHEIGNDGVRALGRFRCEERRERGRTRRAVTHVCALSQFPGFTQWATLLALAAHIARRCWLDGAHRLERDDARSRQRGLPVP